MSRAYLFVEGHGETRAALNLVTRLRTDLGLGDVYWATPGRGKNLHQERGIGKICSLVRTKGDCCALLIIRDEDDNCPKEAAPIAAGWLRAQKLPFPSAIVLAHREYEALFLPCVSKMAGLKLKDEHGIEREGLRRGTSFEGDPQAIRGVKEWLSKRMPPGRAYKPTLDQLPLTRMVEFDMVRQHMPPLPFFGSLERALRFLDREMASGGCGVYPADGDVAMGER